MRKSIFLFIAAIALFSCSSKDGEEKKSEEKKPTEKQEEVAKPAKQDGIQNDGAYREFYSNGKTKIEGFLDQKGEKNGVWKGYDPNGILQSEIFYLDGKKNGHGIVFFPNGQPKYIGEYKNDKKYGKWRFFDEKGNLLKEEVFE